MVVSAGKVSKHPPPPIILLKAPGSALRAPCDPIHGKVVDGKQNSKRYFKVCYIHLKVLKSLMWQKNKITGSKKDNKIMIKHIYSNTSKHENKGFSSILSGKILI